MFLRALLFLVISFLWTGTLNVTPQAYLLAHHPADKSLTLSLIMALGMAASLVGNRISHRLLRRGIRLRPAGLLLGALLCALAMAAILYEVRLLWLYALVYAGLRVTSNTLYNHLDAELVVRAGPGQARQYASAVVTHQLLGQTLGPIGFALLTGHPALATGLIVLLLGLGVAAALPALRTPLTQPPPPTSTASPLTGPSLWPFAAYILFFQAGTMGFLAEFIFLLQDFLGVASPKTMGGGLLTGVGVIAALTAMRQARRGVTMGPGAFLLPVVLMLGALSLFGLRLGSLSLGAAILLAGVGYGQFLVVTRMRASLWPITAERAAILSLYNSLPNFAALLAYAVLALLSISIGEDPARLSPILLATFLLLFATSGLTTLRFPRALWSAEPA